MPPRVTLRLIVRRPLPSVELRVQRGRDGLLTAGTRAGQPDSPWDRRAKVSLMGVRGADVAAALADPGSVLVGEIEGRGRDGGPSCASVPLLGDGWRLAPRDA
jgi:hypothetical protein